MSKNRVVIVKGIAGLGNRLRCVAAAIEYAKKTGREVYIDWTDGMFLPEGENAFNKYFEIADFPAVTEFESLNVETFYPDVYAELPMSGSIYNYFEKEQMKNRFIRKGFHYAFKIAHKIGEKSIVIDNIVCKASQYYQALVLLPEYKEKYGKDGRFSFGAHLSSSLQEDAVIYCDNIPFYKPETMVKHIKLKTDIKERVDAFVKENKLNENTVGVHVRASGKQCFGDIDKFIGKLKKFNEENKIERVFLCTDSNAVEEKFRKEFSEKIVVQKKYIPEITAEQTGIHDFAMDSKDGELQNKLTDEAVVDMFALAQVNYLFYQFGSTFSEISAVYHKDSAKCKSWMSL